MKSIFTRLTLASTLLIFFVAIAIHTNNQLKQTSLTPLALSTTDEDLRFPTDARIVNVQHFGAMGDGKTDDTEAIQQAISWALEQSSGQASPLIYFPKGIYLVSDQLQSRITSQVGQWSDGWRAGMILVGENRTQTVIQLINRASGYNNPNKPKAVIKTGSVKDTNNNPHGTGNRALRHSIINL